MYKGGMQLESWLIDLNATKERWDKNLEVMSNWTEIENINGKDGGKVKNAIRVLLKILNGDGSYSNCDPTMLLSGL